MMKSDVINNLGKDVSATAGGFWPPQEEHFKIGDTYVKQTYHGNYVNEYVQKIFVDNFTLLGQKIHHLRIIFDAALGKNTTTTVNIDGHCVDPNSHLGEDLLNHALHLVRIGEATAADAADLANNTSAVAGHSVVSAGFSNPGGIFDAMSHVVHVGVVPDLLSHIPVLPILKVAAIAPLYVSMRELNKTSGEANAHENFKAASNDSTLHRIGTLLNEAIVEPARREIKKASALVQKAFC